MDHVTGRAFLHPVPPVGTVTVPCCHACQQEMRPSEDRVRETFLLGRPPWSRTLDELPARLARATARRQNRVDPERRFLQRPAGLIAQPAKVIVPRTEDLDVVFFQKHVCGLYYHSRERRFPHADRRIGILTASQADSELRRMARPPIRVGLNEEILYCWRATERGAGTVWLFAVYQAGMVGVWTGSAVAEAPTTFAKGLIVGGNPDSA